MVVVVFFQSPGRGRPAGFAVAVRHGARMRARGVWTRPGRMHARGRLRLAGGHAGVHACLEGIERHVFRGVPSLWCGKRWCVMMGWGRCAVVPRVHGASRHLGTPNTSLRRCARALGGQLAGACAHVARAPCDSDMFGTPTALCCRVGDGTMHRVRERAWHYLMLLVCTCRCASLLCVRVFVMVVSFLGRGARLAATQAPACESMLACRLC